MFKNVICALIFLLSAQSFAATKSITIHPSSHFMPNPFCNVDITNYTKIIGSEIRTQMASWLPNETIQKIEFGVPGGIFDNYLMVGALITTDVDRYVASAHIIHESQYGTDCVDVLIMSGLVP